VDARSPGDPYRPENQVRLLVKFQQRKGLNLPAPFPRPLGFNRFETPEEGGGASCGWATQLRIKRHSRIRSTSLSVISSFVRRTIATWKKQYCAFVDYKCAAGCGTFRDGGRSTAWRDVEAVQSEIPRYSDEAIAATIQYYKYVFEQYGCFPMNGEPFRTLLAYQAHG
jgi:hypothetical protein